MADVNFFGKKISPQMAVVFAAGSGIAIWFAYKQHKASSATASTSLDPVTGLPYSQDSVTDPLTGMPYLAEAQQYGSVSAAESAVAGESSLAYSAGGYSSGGGLVGTSTGASLVPQNEVQGTAYATNAAWAQAVEAGLTDIGYAPTDVSAALGRYLGGLSETAAQATIVQSAVAEYGPPPVGSFQIIQAPASNTTPVSTGGGTADQYPAPSGLHVVTKTPNFVEVQWSPVSPAASSYTVACYQQNGKLVNEFSTPNTIANIGGLTSKYTYHINVWANGGKASPPHSTVTVTLP